MRLKSLLLTALMLVALAALQAQPKELSAYDQSNDGKLSQEEFRGMLKKLNWFTAWDINDNQFISMEEFSRGLVGMYPDKDLDSYERYLRWDLNADHYIKDEEFWIGMFKLYDLDGNEYVSQQEYSEMRYEGKLQDRARAAE